MIQFLKKHNDLFAWLAWILICGGILGIISYDQGKAVNVSAINQQLLYQAQEAIATNQRAIREANSQNMANAKRHARNETRMDALNDKMDEILQLLKKETR